MFRSSSLRLLPLAELAGSKERLLSLRRLLPGCWTATLSQGPAACCASLVCTGDAEVAAAVSPLTTAEAPTSRQDVTFVDRLRVRATGGRGGRGCVSLWKSSAKGGAPALQPVCSAPVALDPACPPWLLSSITLASSAGT